MSKAVIVGWDIGGAHLKFAALDAYGDLLAIEQLPCALWRGMDVLEAALNKAVTQYGLEKARHFCTMTGELVDLFDSRAQGVQQIAQAASRILGADTRFYAAGKGWVGVREIDAVARFVASANWHASASLVAKHNPDALLVDMGSTTTDIVSIVDGKIALQSMTDAERMRDGSLLYTGVVRTPVMALGILDFEDAYIQPAAEYFATMADVYRMLDELSAEYDMAETADGKGKSTLESARRLARMLGCDVEDKTLDVWKELANTCKTMQMQQILAAMQPFLKVGAPIIGAGAGEFLIREIAQKIGYAYEPVSMRLSGHASLCFSAYAVAQLATDHA